MNEQTLLLPQVHPNFFPDSKIPSQAFMPFPKDIGIPSAAEGNQVSAKVSYQHYSTNLGLESLAACPLSVAQAMPAGLVDRLGCIAEILAYTAIDFCALAEKKCREWAKKLKKQTTDCDRLRRAA